MQRPGHNKNNPIGPSNPEFDRREDMSDATQSKATSVLKDKPWILLVAAFTILVIIGIATS